MTLVTTIKQMKDLLDSIIVDIEKAANGNKAAAQRVRVATVKLEKVAKVYRKESVSNEKKTRGKKVTKAKKPVAKKKAAKKRR